MASDDGATGLYEAGDGGGDLLKHGMDGAEACVCHSIDAHDARLKFRHFDEGHVNAVLDSADLRSDFESGVLDLMLAHDCSFPREHDRAAMVAGKDRNVVSANF